MKPYTRHQLKVLMNLNGAVIFYINIFNLCNLNKTYIIQIYYQDNTAKTTYRCMTSPRKHHTFKKKIKLIYINVRNIKNIIQKYIYTIF